MISFLSNAQHKQQQYLITILLLFFYINTNFASSIHVDTIPLPSSLQKIKSKIRSVFQKNSPEKPIKKDTLTASSITIEKTNYWKNTNKTSLILTQTSFVNWTKGGNNIVAGIASYKTDYNYKKGKLYWTNNLDFKYGLSKEKGIKYFQKTDDVIDLKSAVGYKTHKESKWYYSGEFNLTTQFGRGYKGGDRETVISTFFSPARMRIGIGTVYTDNEHAFKLHISPLTNQVTFVLDQNLADKGAFGVRAAIKDHLGNIITKGENINSELGALIRIEYKGTIMKNIDFSLKSSFYSDYINQFGNVDSDIEINIEMKVNKYIQTKISSHLLYDDDSKIFQDDGSQSGPKVQLKQIIGVGIVYSF